MYGELEEVLKYISQKIDEIEAIRLYRELATLYEQARNEPNPEVTNNLKTKIDEIMEAQKKIEPQNWDTVKMKAFEKLGALKLLGVDGADNFIAELESFSNDPHGVSELCTRYANDIESLKKRIEQAIGNLEPLFSDKEELPKGRRRVEIVFDKNVAVEKFGDMATQTREWDLILKSLKFTVPNSPDDGRIWKIYKSSPTTFIFIIPTEQAFSMLSIVAEALSIIASFLTIKLLLSQTRQAPLPIEAKEGIATIIAEAERKQLDEKIGESVDGLVKDSNLSGTEKNLAKTSFSYILKKVYNFFVGGGTVNPLDSVKDQKENNRTQGFSLKYQQTVQTLKTKKETLLLAEFTTEEKKEIKGVTVDKHKEKIRKTSKTKSRKGKKLESLKQKEKIAVKTIPEGEAKSEEPGK